MNTSAWLLLFVDTTQAFHPVTAGVAFGHILYFWQRNQQCYEACSFSVRTDYRFGSSTSTSIVLNSTESSWALSWTALSQAEHCPEQHWVKLSTVLNSTESSWALSWTALSQAEHCPEQHWVKLSTVLNSTESSWKSQSQRWALSWLAMSSRDSAESQ